ncbi:aromatic ring-hydroxylating dioxygenase subunit alpha [bacterium (Candidatus Blackallbacteria) CG17_big_fil_post_rev_8_21_14_2_50_48_46]|uniref:Aromatic ring-hydroxylating dioxygenase subunit alpha n=1 Tax=bacterium (Candidatus Blackallbacteria) CG17_big_fil_post_rev_8_21_14_2_50_48_46 TaxID=2014261 RepID=A0A2M7FY83_9BACT|nr:MAG: Rieske (2Fe-2S) protein [bacterium (Candidatus Blackallbacteria) CG18_big_fil_WC_8_21_14_2_50_49_26]PIW13990.1 MAG: aromatic ring-hydroxylating dioxygenase subunit alpha [bacterium (Candidatus Blackallbacteria) CG17_big_fil_post_rev_8_21_14_2_50_48_46]PIW46841.1 MAG: aromatic ring-hydroxylating dioxygenase subunit alpha [bacterium (Candidatus Blackallbacteria) CG13_big_fil_rev_8_21_14_2_50_49_14]
MHSPKQMTDTQNIHTQPQAQHPVFNNWQVVSEGWYILCSSEELQHNQLLTRDLAGQKLCVFRDSRGQVHAMDGFCPHMGVDLGIGKVVNDRVRCFFHHWEYDANGQCQHIPIQKEIPRKACLKTYACKEKYGFIWVHPDKNTNSSVLEVPSLAGQEVTWRHGKPYTRGCHFHITMINGIDPQHLRTVHNIHMDMEIAIEETGQVITIDLSGETPSTRLVEKWVRKFLGPRYGYSMTYADGCLAALTLMKDVSFFGSKSKRWPELTMFFAYQMITPGKTLVQPIYVTKKRQGLTGWLVSELCLFFTKRAFFALQGEDGQVYENIRFNTRNLLAVDAPVAKYIRYINKLKPSPWGKLWSPPESETAESED